MSLAEWVGEWGLGVPQCGGPVRAVEMVRATRQ